jgi:hypothetical protein
VAEIFLTPTMHGYISIPHDVTSKNVSMLGLDSLGLLVSSPNRPVPHEIIQSGLKSGLI